LQVELQMLQRNEKLYIWNTQKERDDVNFSSCLISMSGEQGWSEVASQIQCHRYVFLPLVHQGACPLTLCHPGLGVSMGCKSQSACVLVSWGFGGLDQGSLWHGTEGVGLEWCRVTGGGNGG